MGSGTGRTLLKTIQTDYNSTYTNQTGQIATSVINVMPIRTTTTWPNGQITKTEKDYVFDVATVSGLATGYGNVIARREYDYGSGAPGPLLRQTKTVFEYTTNSTYLTKNLISMPAITAIYDRGGKQVAQTAVRYDENNGIPQ
jgi:hypothetical protein